MAPPVVDEPLEGKSERADADPMRPPPVATDSRDGAQSINAMETAQRQNAEPFVQPLELRFDDGPLRPRPSLLGDFERAQRYPYAKFEEKRDPDRLEPNADAAAAGKFLAAKKQDVDYSKMFEGGRRTLFFGENHVLQSDNKEIAAQAEQLKKAGVTHFAMEMIPASMQPTLDAYFKGDAKAREATLAYLKEHWGDKHPDAAANYMGLLDAMKAQGIRPVGLDTDTHDITKVSERNEFWASTINDILKADPKARVVAFGGSGHTGYYPINDSANQILDHKYGQKSSVVEFAGGERPEDYQTSVDAEIARGAQAQKMDKDRFMVPLNQTFARPADFVVHLPQVEKPPKLY